MMRVWLPALFVTSLGAVTPAVAAPYVALRAGASAMTIDTDQYMYQATDAYKSTIVNGDIVDINAVYHAAIGYGFGPLRLEAEYGYGNYAFSGHWALNTKNEVPGSLPPNLSYPATYSLTERVNMIMANMYYEFLVFNRMFGRPIKTPDGEMQRRLRAQSGLFVMGGVGMSRMKDRASVSIDTTMAWGGNPLHEEMSGRVNRFAYSLGGGVAIGLSRDVSVDLSYKYTNMGKYEQDTTRRDYALHEIIAGIRYTF